MSALYDIVVDVDKGHAKDTYVYRQRTSETINAVMSAMDYDRIFGLLDDEMRLEMFKPNQVTKLQINLVLSLSR